MTTQNQIPTDVIETIIRILKNATTYNKVVDEALEKVKETVIPLLLEGRYNVICVKDIYTFEPYHKYIHCISEYSSEYSTKKKIVLYRRTERRKDGDISVEISCVRDALLIEYEDTYSRGPSYHKHFYAIMINSRPMETIIVNIASKPEPYMNTGWQWRRSNQTFHLTIEPIIAEDVINSICSIVC